MADAHYTQLIHTAEEQLLRFLRTFESIQEHIQFNKIGDSQAELQAVTGDMFSTLADELTALSPPDALTEFHATFTAALAQCARRGHGVSGARRQGFLAGVFAESLGLVQRHEPAV